MTDELPDLVRLYEQVYADGFFVHEYFAGFAAVGDLRDLQHLAASVKPPVTPDDALQAMSPGELVDLTVPGEGTTRVARVRDAWRKAQDYRARGGFPRLAAVRERLGLPVQDPKPLGTF